MTSSENASVGLNKISTGIRENFASFRIKSCMHKDVSWFFTGSASKLPDAQVNFDQIRRVVGIFDQIFHPFLLGFFKKSSPKTGLASQAQAAGLVDSERISDRPWGFLRESRDRDTNTSSIPRHRWQEMGFTSWPRLDRWISMLFFGTTRGGLPSPMTTS